MRLKTTMLAVIGILGIQTAPAWSGNLMESYQQALANDPQLKQAEFSRQAANEHKAQANAGFRPQVNLGANASRNRFSVGSNSTDYNSMGYTLSLTQPLYHRDNYVNSSKAELSINQAEDSLKQARQSLMLRTAQAYFSVLSSQDNLSVANAEKTAFEKQLEQVKQRFKVGLSTRIDLNEAQAAYDNAVARTISAENELIVSRERLREITNQDASSFNSLTESVPLVSPDPADAAQWVQVAKDQNPQLAALRNQVNLAREDINAARAKHYPTLDLVGSHRYTDKQNFGATTIKDSTLTSLSLQLNVPIYQGGMTDSQIRQTQHTYSAAQASYETQSREIERITRAAYLNVVTGINRVNALKQSLTSAESMVEASEAGVEVGTRTTVDVLNARKQLYATQRDYALARYNYVLATLNLKQATGQLTEGDLEQVNQWLK